MESGKLLRLREKLIIQEFTVIIVYDAVRVYLHRHVNSFDNKISVTTPDFP